MRSVRSLPSRAARAARLPGIAGIALLAAGLNAAAASAAAAPPVRLLAPEEGMVLAAGSTATLEWAPTADLVRQAGWEEWEAFLSLDGGATYAIRITPHLDRDLRRIRFQVPGFPTRDARLLLRFGDERREALYELPQRFSILPSPGIDGAAAGNVLDLPRTVWRRGEPARPGEPGVVAWVEGPRRGGPIRQVVTVEPPRAGPGLALPAALPALAAVISEPPPSGAPAADAGARSPLPAPRADAATSARRPLPRTTDLLLLLTRRNE
jgi:hypothetical protein